MLELLYLFFNTKKSFANVKIVEFEKHAWTIKMTPTKDICQTTDLVILGSGITGLAANYYLRDQLSCLILEKSSETGGVIKTTRQRGFLLEHGPDRFMNQKPWALNLALELGLQSELLESKNFQRRVYLLKNNK